MEHQGLRILFNSWDTKYKKPFGALKTGQECFLNIHVPQSCPATNVFFVLQKDGETEKFLKMQKGKTEDYYSEFCLKFSINKKGLYFYWFYVEKQDGGFRLFRQGQYDTNMEAGDKWQITCYDKNYGAPDWAKGKVFYQIFPDRFYKSGSTNLENKLTPFTVHENITDCPNWFPDQNGNWNNDFFGGNLNGIIEKLDYIKDLGADIIYLNPIVKAFSNHRYDTADYKSVDPMLGTLKDFKKLCDEAHARNIKIIIDGVFSHTGNKSIYFEEAVKRENSPYRDWYDFKSFPDHYTAWWGIKTLPQIKKGHPEFIKFITEDVIPFWLGLGVDGIRLDVADELTDGFIKKIKESAQDKLIIGEIWEDASNKISYGFRRSYLHGDELDSVMNYPFLNAVVGFVKREKSADDFANEIMMIAENYPPEILSCCMNMLSTHDTVRIITLLSAEDFNKTKNEKANYRLADRKNAEDVVKNAAFLQFMLPGSPSIYYGDEVGMEGFEDPFNRRFFEWDKVGCDLFLFYKKLCRIKHEYPCLKGCNIKFENDRNVLIFARDNLKIIVNMTDVPFNFSGEVIISHNQEKDKIFKNGFALIKK